MAANDLAPAYTELLRWTGRRVGASRTSSDWSSLQNTDLLDGLRAGLRQFYYPPVLPNETVPHVWSFLQPTLASIEVHAAYETGTVAVSTKTVTLTSGTWPTWAAKGELYVDGGWYTVASRTSNTVIVLDYSAGTIAAGTEYSLVQREYALPDDFGGVVEPFSLRRDQQQWTELGVVSKRLQQVSESVIRSYDDSRNGTGPPDRFAIVSVAPTSAQESKSALMIAPSPDQDYQLWYRYMVTPPTLDASTNVYAYGSAPYAETLKLSCLDKVMQTLYDSDEEHGRFLESLVASVRRDRLLQGPTQLGKSAMSDGYSYDRRDYIRRQATLDTSGYNL